MRHESVFSALAVKAGIFDTATAQRAEAAFRRAVAEAGPTGQQLTFETWAVSARAISPAAMAHLTRQFSQMPFVCQPCGHRTIGEHLGMRGDLRCPRCQSTELSPSLAPPSHRPAVGTDSDDAMEFEPPRREQPALPPGSDPSESMIDLADLVRDATDPNFDPDSPTKMAADAAIDEFLPPLNPGVLPAASVPAWKPSMVSEVMPRFDAPTPARSNPGPPPAPPLVGEDGRPAFNPGERLERAERWIESREWDKALLELQVPELAAHPRAMVLASTIRESKERINGLIAAAREARLKADLTAAEEFLLDLHDMTPSSFAVGASLDQLQAEREWMATIEQFCMTNDFVGALAHLDEIATHVPGTLWLSHVRAEIEPLTHAATATVAEDADSQAPTTVATSAPAAESTAGRDFRPAPADQLRPVPVGLILGLAGGALGLLLVIGVIVAIVGNRPDPTADVERAKTIAAPEERARELQRIVQENPDHLEAATALQAAKIEWQTQQFETALALDNPKARLDAVTMLMKQFPDTPIAEAALNQATRAFAEWELETQIRGRLNQILGMTNPRSRAEALRQFQRDHPHDPSIETHIAEAEADAFRLDLQARTDRLDWLDRLVALRDATEHIGRRPGSAWSRLKRELDETTRMAEEAVVDQLRRAAMAMETSGDPTEFLAGVERVNAIVPTVGESFAPLVARAEQIQADNDEGAALRQRAAAVSVWYDAETWLSTTREFVERVPRQTEAMQPSMASMLALAAERPPRIAGFTYLRMHVAADGSNARVHVYRCDAFATALNLPMVPDGWAVRAAGGAFTRPDVEFVLLPPIGVSTIEFQMGSPDDEDGRSTYEALHRVTITKPYLIARTETSQAVWQAVVRRQSIEALKPNPSHVSGARRPVEQVSWNDAVAFCHAVDLRLPTEAEWGFACRAGSLDPFAFGATITPEQVNYDGRFPYRGGPRGLNRQGTVDVASLPGNRFGLHEVHGNVAEWCADWFDSFPANAHRRDPTGPDRGVVKVFRGGSWRSSALHCRGASRDGFNPTNGSREVGFRAAATPTILPSSD